MQRSCWHTLTGYSVCRMQQAHRRRPRVPLSSAHPILHAGEQAPDIIGRKVNTRIANRRSQVKEHKKQKHKLRGTPFEGNLPCKSHLQQRAFSIVLLELHRDVTSSTMHVDITSSTFARKYKTNPPATALARGRRARSMLASMMRSSRARASSS